MSNNKKPRLIGEILFFIASIVLWVLLVPLAFIIGVFATDAPGSGIFEMLGGFFFIEGIPSVLVVISFVLLIRKVRKNRKKSELQQKIQEDQ